MISFANTDLAEKKKASQQGTNQPTSNQLTNQPVTNQQTEIPQ